MRHLAGQRHRGQVQRRAHYQACDDAVLQRRAAEPTVRRPATATLGYYDTFGSDAPALRRESDTYKPGVVFTVSVDVP